MAGWPSKEVTATYGSYGVMIERLLKGDGETWTHFDVEGGREMPSLEALKAYDGIVVSGSRHSVYDDEKWIHDLSDLVKGAVARRQRVLGLCFGAQMIAHALGGEVKPAGFWEAGARRCEATKLGIEDYDVCQLHKDAIVRLPDGAERWASSQHTQNELFAVGSALAVQGHPEFSTDVVTSLIHSRTPHVIDADVAEASLRSLDLFPPPAPSAENSPLRALCSTFLKS